MAGGPSWNCWAGGRMGVNKRSEPQFSVWGLQANLSVTERVCAWVRLLELQGLCTIGAVVPE